MGLMARLIKNLPKRKILYAILATFIVSLIYIGYNSYKQVQELTNTIEDFYEHPYKVRNAINYFRLDIEEIKDIENHEHGGLFYDDKMVHEESIFELFKSAESHLDIINSQYLGDKRDIERLKESFKELEGNFGINESLGSNEINHEFSEILRIIIEIEERIKPVEEFSIKKGEYFINTSLSERAHLISRLNSLYFLITFFTLISFGFVGYGSYYKNKKILKEKSKFENFVEFAPIPIMIHRKGDVLALSKTWTDLTGYTLNDIPTIKEWTEAAYGDSAGVTQEFINKLYELKKPISDGIWSITTKEGNKREWKFFSGPLDEITVISTAIDVTDELEYQKQKNLKEVQLEKINKRLSLINETLNNVQIKENESNDYILQQALKLSESEYGCFFEQNELLKELKSLSFVRNDGASISSQEIEINDYLLKQILKNQILKNKKPLIINDFKEYEKLGEAYPKIETDLQRCMIIPVIDNDEVVLVIGAANKSIDYTTEDVSQLEALIYQAWNVIKAKKSEISNRKLAEAVNQTPASIVITDTNGKIEYVNNYFSKITGYSYEEAIGKNPSILKSGFQSDEIYKDLWTTISKGNVWSGELQNKAKDSSLYWESVSISPIIDHLGNIVNYVAVKENITEYKRLIDEIEYSEQLKTSIINTLSEGLVFQDVSALY